MTMDEFVNRVHEFTEDQDKRISALITEVSFPSDMEALATASKHYTPRLLHEDLQKLQRHDLVVHLMHLKPNFLFCSEY